MFTLSTSVTQGAVAALTVVLAFGGVVWLMLNTGALCFGREVAYRDRIIDQQAKTIDEQRGTIASQAAANLQQAEASKQALSLIRDDLLPRLARASGI